MTHSEIVIDNHYHDFNPIQFGYETCAPSHSYGPAVRTHWLLHYVVSGFGQFTREGKTYNIHPGQIFVIPPYLETYYEADSKQPWRYTWIGFTTNSAPEVFLKPVISCHNAGSIFDEMITCSKFENCSSAFLSACIWKLVSILLEHNNNPEPDYIDKALNFMHAEYANGITIQQIAEQLGLDRSYLYTLFLERTGISPSEYLINLRLSKAAELMTVYKMSPSTAAISVGYDDLCHFSKIFKKYYGLPPRDYSKKGG